MKQEHKNFADDFIKHGDATLAYLNVNPNAKPNSARVMGYKWLQKVSIQEYIKGITDRINEKAENLLIGELSNKKYTNLLTSAEKRHMLSQIARGEVEFEDLIVIGREVKKIRRKPDFHERIKAIMEENKMTGDIAPSKISQTDPEGKAIEIKGNTAIFKIDLNAAI